MRVLEAKDFLVQQTAEQAALENVPFSDLEKRMMYFTETDECPEDPFALNDAFEAEYKSNKYEAKISKLLTHAYRRLLYENSPAVEKWKTAVKALQEGDHYLLVLLGKHTRIPLRSWLRLLGRLAILVLAAYILWLGLKYFLLATGISGSTIFGLAFVLILLAVAIKPLVMSKLAERSVLWLVVFLLKRKDSGSQGG